MDQAKRLKDLEKENGKFETAGRGTGVGQTDIKGYCGGKLPKPGATSVRRGACPPGVRSE